MKQIVLIDQDGPLASFEKGFLREWRRRYPDHLHVPLELRTTFYPRDQYPSAWEEMVDEIYHAPGFIRNLPPTEGAVAAVREIMGRGHEVFICTSPLRRYEHCVLEKYEWVERYFGYEMTKRIILTRDKTLVRGHVLIDDKPNICGSILPRWEHVRYTYPYNAHVRGVRRMTWDNWKEVLSEL